MPCSLLWLERVMDLPSRGVFAVLNQVVEHLIAALDKVRLKATLTIGLLTTLQKRDGC